MIIGCLKLPDTYGYEYANTLLTSFGIAGRIIEASNALAFYKIIVTHGQSVIEYVMASTQRFTFDNSNIEEIVSGVRFNNSKFVNLAPISMKLITPEFCDNFLFVEPISYLLMFGGNHTVNSDRLLVEFSTPPTKLAPGFCTMCVDNISNVISINTLVELLSEDMYDLDENPPIHTYALELNKITSILKDKTAGKANICNLVSLNDFVVFHWLFESLNLAKQFVMAGKYPLLPDREFRGIRERFDIFQTLVMTEPVFRTCISSPSVINLSKLFPYLDRNSIALLSKISTHCETYGNIKYQILDSRHPYFQQLDIRDLIQAVMYSPISSFEIINESTPIVKCADGWFNVALPEHYSKIISTMDKMRMTIFRITNSRYVKITLLKNALDEIRLHILIDNILEYYYIPLWYYNLSSPCALNEPLLYSMQQVFNKI